METSLFIVIKGKLECGINGDRFITQHDAQGVRAPVCQRCYKAWKTAHQASVNTPHCLFCSLYSKYACQILILSAIFAVHTKIPSLFTSIAGNTSVSMQHVNITVYGGKLMLWLCPERAIWWVAVCGGSAMCCKIWCKLLELQSTLPQLSVNYDWSHTDTLQRKHVWDFCISEVFRCSIL